MECDILHPDIRAEARAVWREFRFLSHPNELAKQPSTKIQRKADALTALNPDHAHQLFHRVGAFVERGLLFAREFDLDDLLDSP